jgi:hypothetical protein
MFEPNTAPGSETEIASGGPLMVDVEFGRGRSLFGLSQGVWNGAYPGSPASPGTGALLEVAWNGEFDEIASLDLAQPPTSLEVVGNTAYVVTLDDPFTPMPEGEIWVIDNITNSPFGFASHD